MNINLTCGRQPRLSWIDSMRGLAILLVVLGHSIGNITDPMNRFILSFHMPVFFFISGLVSKCKSRDGMIPFTKYLFKKVRTILVPQLTLFVLNTGFDLFIEHETISLNLLLTNAFNWFLVVLFYVSVLFWIAEKIGLIQKKLLLLSLLGVLTILTQVFSIKTLIHIETMPMAMVFFLWGHYFIRMDCSRDSIKGGALRNYWIAIIPIMVICSYWNRPVTMYDNSYGNLLLFAITSICGTWITYEIGISLKENTLLRWLGENSIIIYIFHARILNVLHGLGKKIFPVLSNSNYLYPANWHYFLITLIVLVPVVYICDRYVPWLFGKSKSRRT